MLNYIGFFLLFHDTRQQVRTTLPVKSKDLVLNRLNMLCMDRFIGKFINALTTRKELKLCEL